MIDLYNPTTDKYKDLEKEILEILDRLPLLKQYSIPVRSVKVSFKNGRYVWEINVG